MNPTTPLWRQMFNNWEKQAGPVLAQAAVSPQFREVVRVGARMNKAFLAEVERASAQWLHAWNLPAGSDVRSLRGQVRDLEKELRSMRRNLEALVEDRTIRDLNLLLGEQGIGEKGIGDEVADSDDTKTTAHEKNGNKPAKSKK